MSNMKCTDEPIVVEQCYRVPASRVWQAITDPKQMIQWYFPSIESFEPRVGFETEFLVENEGRSFPHLWKIIEVVPEQRLAYDYNWRGYPGATVVRFDLRESESKTILRVTHKVLENLQEGIPEFSREACLGGWTYFLKESLKAYLGE